MYIEALGIDLAETPFQLCAINQAGKEVFNQQVRRTRLRTKGTVCRRRYQQQTRPVR